MKHYTYLRDKYLGIIPSHLVQENLQVTDMLVEGIFFVKKVVKKL
jgi:hypothetical protein